VEFETEEQQIEAIKSWWKTYGPTLFLGLVLGLAGVFGYRYYNTQQEAELAMVSDAYDVVIELLNDETNKDQFIAAATSFNKIHQDSVYNNLLALQLAKFAVDAKDLGSAAQHLKDVLANPQHKTIEHTARIRLARILIAQKKYDDTLALIAEATGDEYRNAYEMLRGEVWLAKDDRVRALKAFKAAKENATDGPLNPDLDLLLTELSYEDSDALAKSE